MVWIHSINESAADEFSDGILNPMHPDKFRTLGTRIRLRPGQRVLDIGAGRCGPALVLAKAFGCNVTAVEPHFLDAAMKRVEDAGLTERFEFIRSTGADFTIEPDHYDVAMCIGAEWAFGGLEGTIQALHPGVGDGGHVVIGTGYFAEGSDSEFSTTFEEVIATFERNGLCVVSVFHSRADDFDTYFSVQSTSLLDWLEANRGNEETDRVRTWRREAVARFTETPFGWAVIAGRKTDP
jgi:cyclopropane fatty-acyl-phospholipid synthase-like methyltransferase